MEHLLAFITIGVGSAVFVVTALGKIKYRVPLRLVLVAYLILNFIDTLLTMDGLIEFGPAVEANPLILRILEVWGPWGLFMDKLLVNPLIMVAVLQLASKMIQPHKLRAVHSVLWFGVAIQLVYIIPRWLFGSLTCRIREGIVFGLNVAPICEVSSLLF